MKSSQEFRIITTERISQRSQIIDSATLATLLLQKLARELTIVNELQLKGNV
jgi:hypothetical protein